MKNFLSHAALAAMIALPLMAGPADASCRSRKLNGAILGGVGGALLGGAVTHGSTGPIVGGVGGAVVGHEIGRNGCDRRSAYQARHHASRHASNAVATRKVYYDREGNVVGSEPVYARR